MTQPMLAARWPWARERAPEVLASGAVAGLIGGAAMMLFLMLDLGGLGLGFLAPFAYIAAFVLGPKALVYGAGALILGGLIHVAVSVALGVIFSALVPRDTGGGPALSYGLTAGLLALVFMTFVILPWADPTLFARVGYFQISWLFGHVLFGIGLSFAPSLRRGLFPAP